MTLLALNGLTKTFETPTGPVHAVSDVSLNVQAGECLAIVGESGSGKTTIANMILGILAATSGEIAFDGQTLSAKRSAEQRRRIQLVQQNPLSSLNPKRSIGASVRLGLDVYDIGERSGRWTAVEAALDAVGLPGNMRTRAPASLSGGQRSGLVLRVHWPVIRAYWSWMNRHQHWMCWFRHAFCGFLMTCEPSMGSPTFSSRMIWPLSATLQIASQSSNPANWSNLAKLRKYSRLQRPLIPVN